MFSAATYSSCQYEAIGRAGYYNKGGGLYFGYSLITIILPVGMMAQTLAPPPQGVDTDLPNDDIRLRG